MDYITDLERNVEIAEEHLNKAIECYEKGWTTALDIHISVVKSVLKSSKFCITCAKKTMARMEEKGKDPKEFACEGGCVRAGALEKFEERNRKLRYILSLREGLETENFWPFKGEKE
jgi:iron only hydrogenase large subunit-like protein